MAEVTLNASPVGQHHLHYHGLPEVSAVAMTDCRVSLSGLSCLHELYVLRRTKHENRVLRHVPGQDIALRC